MSMDLAARLLYTEMRVISEKISVQVLICLYMGVHVHSGSRPARGYWKNNFVSASRAMDDYLLDKE